MDSEVKEFKLDVTRAHYIQNGLKVPMDIGYLKFRQNGTIYMDGVDENGTFDISGELSEGYMNFTKQYHGKHSVFYLGKLVGNNVALVYDFSPKWEDLRERLDKNEITAEMEFETNTYKLQLEETGEVCDLFLTKRTKPGKFKGLIFRNGQFMSVNAKVTCKVELSDKNTQESFKGNFDTFNDTFVVKRKADD